MTQDWLTRWLVTCDRMAEVAFRVGPAVKWISGITEQTTCKVRPPVGAPGDRGVRPIYSGAQAVSEVCLDYFGLVCVCLCISLCLWCLWFLWCLWYTLVSLVCLCLSLPVCVSCVFVPYPTPSPCSHHQSKKLNLKQKAGRSPLLSFLFPVLTRSSCRLLPPLAPQPQL